MRDWITLPKQWLTPVDPVLSLWVRTFFQRHTRFVPDSDGTGGAVDSLARLVFADDAQRVENADDQSVGQPLHAVFRPGASPDALRAQQIGLYHLEFLSKKGELLVSEEIHGPLYSQKIDDSPHGLPISYQWLPRVSKLLELSSPHEAQTADDRQFAPSVLPAFDRPNAITVVGQSAHLPPPRSVFVSSQHNAFGTSPARDLHPALKRHKADRRTALLMGEEASHFRPDSRDDDEPPVSSLCSSQSNPVLERYRILDRTKRDWKYDTASRPLYHVVAFPEWPAASSASSRQAGGPDSSSPASDATTAGTPTPNKKHVLFRVTPAHQHQERDTSATTRESTTRTRLLSGDPVTVANQRELDKLLDLVAAQPTIPPRDAAGNPIDGADAVADVHPPRPASDTRRSPQVATIQLSSDSASANAAPESARLDQGFLAPTPVLSLKFKCADAGSLGSFSALGMNDTGDARRQELSTNAPLVRSCATPSASKNAMFRNPRYVFERAGGTPPSAAADEEQATEIEEYHLLVDKQPTLDDFVVLHAFPEGVLAAPLSLDETVKTPQAGHDPFVDWLLEQKQTRSETRITPRNEESQSISSASSARTTSAGVAPGEVSQASTETGPGGSPGGEQHPATSSTLRAFGVVAAAPTGAAQRNDLPLAQEPRVTGEAFASLLAAPEEAVAAVDAGLAAATEEAAAVPVSRELQPFFVKDLFAHELATDALAGKPSHRTQYPLAELPEWWQNDPRFRFPSEINSMRDTRPKNMRDDHLSRTPCVSSGYWLDLAHLGFRDSSGLQLLPLSDSEKSQMTKVQQYRPHGLVFLHQLTVDLVEGPWEDETIPLDEDSEEEQVQEEEQSEQEGDDQSNVSAYDDYDDDDAASERTFGADSVVSGSVEMRLMRVKVRGYFDVHFWVEGYYDEGAPPAAKNSPAECPTTYPNQPARPSSDDHLHRKTFVCQRVLKFLFPWSPPEDDVVRPNELPIDVANELRDSVDAWRNEKNVLSIPFLWANRVDKKYERWWDYLRSRSEQGDWDRWLNAEYFTPGVRDMTDGATLSFKKLAGHRQWRCTFPGRRMEVLQRATDQGHDIAAAVDGAPVSSAP
ncbi:unnamed protein product [Amoebophrya sp. A120]|nr:unnamed protein product [Amoebophrya sp. A120]|eukprot:GSA120T00010266001.1